MRLESLAAGVDRLRAHEAVVGGRVATLGTSVGAEAALAMASYIRSLELAAVAGVAPSSVVWQALEDGRPPDRPRWTLGGRPLDYARVRGERLLWQILIENPLRRFVRRQPELHTARAYEAGLRQPAARQAAIPVERINAPLLPYGARANSASGAQPPGLLTQCRPLGPRSCDSSTRRCRTSRRTGEPVSGSLGATASLSRSAL
jgi:BAAT / Acyl-CoA thioester hydrolase C terminal